MARQTYYVTREQRHPLYRTRMLQAGPLDLDAGAARLYRQLGVELSDEAPRKAATKSTANDKEFADELLRASEKQEAAPKPAPKKAAPKAKRATRRTK